MSKNIYEDDIFFQELISNYTDKLFYFCLKKTDDRYEAENLASDIILNVLDAHKRWPSRVNFSSWFWQIARNRYSVWAKKKSEHDRWISKLDADVYDIEDEDAKTEELILKKENINLLRRELAFASSSYREFIVAYYIENKSIKEIAAALGTSESAVKNNLFRARKALKEGMEMARTFGIRSYHPGEVVFDITGNNTRTMYTSIKRLLPQNILLEAYENPSTIEELAVAAGTAVPYIEEEINILSQKGFLKRVGEKYFTNFLISSRETQYEIYNLQCRYIRELSTDIDTIVSDLLPDIRSLGTVTERLKDSDLKWLFLLYAVDVFLDFRARDNIASDTGKYRVIGFEKNNIPESIMGHRHITGEDNEFLKYFVNDYGFKHDNPNMFSAEADLLASIFIDKRTVSSLSSAEKRIWDTFINNTFAYEEEDGTVVPMLFTVTEENRNKITAMIKTHPLGEKVAATLSDIIERSTQILTEVCPPDLRDDCEAHALTHMRRIHNMMIKEEVESGRLTVPEHPDTSNACCYFVIKNR